MMKIRRRQFFVKKEFQGKFILLYALTIILISFVTTFILDARLNDAVNRLFFSSHLEVRNTAEFVHAELLKVNMIAILLLAVGTIGVSLLVFRRLNAHFQRIGHVFDSMAGGRYDSPALPVSRFNEISSFIALVEEVKGSCSNRSARLTDVTTQLRRVLERGAGAGELEALHGRLRTILEEVRLPGEGEGNA